LSEKGVKKLEKYLNKGYSIYFLGLKDPNKMGELFYDGKFNEELKDGNVEQQVTFISKNKDGEIFLGAILSEEKYSDERLFTTLIASTWNRRNDYNYSKKKAEFSFIEKVTNKVYASNDADFNIGSKWKNVYPWTQYSVDTGFGTQTEWKAGFYLTDSTDGQNYYAMAIETAMDPDTSATTSKLRYISDADSNGQANKLKSYAPKVSPSSNTLSFNIGGSYSKSGVAKGSIGAS